MTSRRAAGAAAVVFGTLALVYLVWVFRQAVILFLFSLAVAAAARPFVEWFTVRGWRRSYALLLVYLVFLGGLTAILFAFGSSLMVELQRLADGMAREYDRIWAEWPSGTEVQKNIVRQLPAPADLYQNFSPERQNSAMQGLMGVTIGSATFIGQLVTVIILSIYWGIDQVHFERLWLSLLPVESRARSRDVWRNIERDFGSYVRSEVMQSIFVAVLLGLGLWALGVEYPNLLAIFGALAWLIPWLGGVLAVLPIVLIALAESVWLAVFASLFAVAVLFVMEFIIEPRFIRRRRYSPLLSILLIIALVEPFGLMGLLVAPPLAAAIELVFRYNLQMRSTPVGIESTERMAGLRERLANMRQSIASKDEPLEPQMESLLTRLESLIDRSDDALKKDSPRPINRARV